MGIMRGLKPVKTFCLIILFVPLLTGCWDRLEIEERAVVLGISIDAAGPEAEQQEDEISHLRGSLPQKKMIHVAAQIALPGRIPLGPGEGGGGGGGKEERTVWVLEVVGHTIDDALQNLDQQVSGKLFFGHLRVIVISEEMAKRGIENLNDYLRRNSEVRRMAWMFVSKGKARDLMMAVPKLERVPSLYLSSTLDGAVKRGKLPPEYVGMYWSKSSRKGQEGILPYVKLMKEQSVEISGLAYFRGEKMVGVTKPFQIISYMAIKGLNPAGYRAVLAMDGAEDILTVNATHRTSKIDVSIRDGRPHLKVTVFVELNLEEKASEHFKADSPDALQIISQKVTSSVTKTYNQLIKQTQDRGSDIFGFGEHVRAKESKYWNSEIKTKVKWQEMYKTIAVDVSVNTKMRRIGMKAK